MKKTLTFLSLGAAMTMALGSCMNEDMQGVGEGKLLLSASLNSNVKVASRAIVDDEQLAKDCQIWISNSKGVVYRFTGVDNVPSEGLRLLSDHYTAEAWAGDSVGASWDSRWFKGVAEFDITAGQTSRVALECKIANTLVTVSYDESALEVLEDFVMTVGHTRDKLSFEGQTDAIGYFMMPSGTNDLTWKLEGKLKSDGSDYVREGSIDDVKPAYKYNLKVSCNYDDGEIGGLYFNVEVDAEEEEIYENVDIVLAPEISGYGFDINTPVTAAEGKIDHKSVFVKSGTKIASVVLESTDFPSTLGFDEGEYDIDLFAANDSYKQLLQQGGITASYMPNEEDGTSMMKIRFEETYTLKLLNGVHAVKITARDVNGKETTRTLTFNVSDAKASTTTLTPVDVWTYSATLRGTILVDGVTYAKFRYRAKGSPDWTEVDAQPETSRRSRSFEKGQNVMALLNNLDADTEYEWTLLTDDFETSIETFRTGTNPQLPNASFENWQKPGKPWLIYGEGEDMFWDSGNHGSTTISANGSITTPVTSPVHDGSNSIQLKSTTVIVKFAAGNVFAGEYLDTSGTDGILGWGRPFTGRPKQLKFWAHYTSKTIDRNDGGNEIPADVKETYAKGKPDVGTIYVALMDDNTESYGGKRYPIVVKTSNSASNRRLFEPNGVDKPHVIAYGIHDFTESTPGTDLQEFTIDLDYFQNDKIPSYIILTASASKGGDYFMGGAGSTLIIDDIQLIY